MSKTSLSGLVDLLPTLNHPNSKYQAEDKLQAVSGYVLTGSPSEASKISGVPASTIRKWKQEAPWWEDAVAELRKIKQDELDGLLTGAVHSTISALVERLEKGDVYVTRTGQIKTKALTARDLASIFGVLYDKRALQRGQAPSKSEERAEKQIEKIKEEFEKLAKDIDKKLRPKITLPEELKQTYAAQERSREQTK